MWRARTAFVATAAGVAALTGAWDPAYAHHSPHWTGVSDLDPPLSGDWRDTFIVQQWTRAGQGVPVKWCANFNGNDKPALQEAISDWMAAFSSSFGNEFVEGTPCDLEFRWDAGNPCGSSAAWARHDRTRFSEWDAARGGWYLTGGIIYFVGLRSWTLDRYRAVAAHELGHFHNMWEQYQDPSFTCWSGSSSIMDVNIPGALSCDGVVGPTSWDKNIVADVYSIRRADHPSAAGGTGTMTYWWWNINWSEDHVAVHIRRCDLASTCSSGYLGVQVHGYQHTQGVAPWEGDEGGAVGATWARGANPEDQYRACFAPWNRVINTYTTYDCSPWVQVN